MQNAYKPDDALDFSLRVEGFFHALIQFADATYDLSSATLPSLGGKLLFAGELDESGRALMAGGNIAGAATLAATADPAAQRQAIREGAADFLVNSLDEALRILKNEIRKHEPVAVCVSLQPAAIAEEMAERGVQPDLLAPSLLQDLSESTALATFLRHGAQAASRQAETGVQSMLVWSIAEAPARWMPKADAVVLDKLPAAAWRERRWLLQSPRFLGRRAQGLRLLRCPEETAFRIIAALREETEDGAIDAPLEARLLERGSQT